jgi:outer membrane autotransporter protein
MALARWRVEPTASVSVLSLTSGGTHETPGVALAEDIAGQRNTSAQSFAGVRLARMVRLAPDLSLQVRGLLGWSHEMGDNTAEARAGLAAIDGAAFTVGSAAAGRDAARLGFSVNAQLTPQIAVYGSYTGDFAQERDSQSLTTGVRARW